MSGQRMLASHRLFRISGIDVRVAYMLYVFIGAVLFAHCSGVGPALSPERRTGIAVVLLLYPFFTLLHELGHAVVALRMGLEVRQIILHPIGGTAELRGLLPGPGAEIRVAAAGPLASLAVCALLVPGMVMEGVLNPLQVLDKGVGLVGLCLGVGVLINGAMGVFNMFPIFPMDGGRIATALLVRRFGPEQGISYVKQVARTGVGLLVVAGGVLVWYDAVRAGLALMLIGSFLYTSGHQELQARMLVARYMGSRTKEEHV